MVNAIQKWTANSTATPVFLLHPDICFDIQDGIVVEQSKIGWDQFFCSYASTTWEKFGVMPMLKNSQPIHKAQLQRVHKGTKLNTDLVGIIQQYTLMLWAAQNDVLHNEIIKTQVIVNARINEETNQINWGKDK